jgi:pimeloyl-ACP methyl ester carboxylesterase
MPCEIRAGHATHWQSFGQGPRQGLAIHCSLAHSGAWAGVLSPLAARLTATAFDLPGHGQSGDWDGAGDYLTLATRVAASFIETPVDLIGHSYGALVALRLAIAAPEAIRTLTLIEPVLIAAAAGTHEGAEHADQMAAFETAMLAGDRPRAAREFTAVWGTGVPWDEMNAGQRAGVEGRIHLIAAGAPAIFGDSGDLLAPDALESLELPVMLIRGDRSPSVIYRVTEEIAARLPDVGVATVPGAGHMVPITHPAEVAGLIGVNLDRG